MIEDDLVGRAEASARRQAAREGVSFRLDAAAIRGLWIAQHGRCALTGVAFSERRFDDAPLAYPLAPMLTPIQPAEGYVPGNVRLVAQIALFLRERWGLEMIQALRAATDADVADAEMDDRDMVRQGRACAVADPMQLHGHTGDSPPRP